MRHDRSKTNAALTMGSAPAFSCRAHGFSIGDHVCCSGARPATRYPVHLLQPAYTYECDVHGLAKGLACCERARPWAPPGHKGMSCVTKGTLCQGTGCKSCGKVLHHEGNSHYCPTCDDYKPRPANCQQRTRRGRARRNGAMPALSKAYNGWKNKATWNVALWVTNDEKLYNLAVAYVRRTKAQNERVSWSRFVSYAGLGDMRTPDRIKYNGQALNHEELDDMLRDLVS